MISQEHKCDSCGEALESEESACKKCEEILSNKALERDSNTGKYQCPSCLKRFNSPAIGNFPLNASWYYPKSLCKKCPHCGAFLKDRLNPDMSLAEKIAIIIAMIFSLFTGNRYIPPLLLAYLFIKFMVEIRKAIRSTRSKEQRYELK